MLSDDRITTMCRERDEFVQFECGYWYYWPSGYDGGLSPQALRVIADELDKMNADWHAQVCHDLSNAKPVDMGESA